MSWLFGKYGSNQAEEGSPIRTSSSLLASAKRGPVNVFIGGNPRTSFLIEKDRASWAIVGAGFVTRNHRYHLLTEDDWAAYLTDLQFEEIPRLLSGHFIVAKICDDEIRFCTDSTGLRSLYVRSSESGYLFSTRAPWLTEKTRPLQVDVSQFFTHWYGLNQLEPASLYRDVTRICSGSEALIRDGVLSTKLISESSSASEIDAKEEGDVFSTLSELLTPSEGGVSVGLSGGLDSRLLTAKLIQAGNDFQTHVFGESDSQDVVVSEMIARKIGRRHQKIPITIPKDRALLPFLSEYAQETSAVTPVSAAVKLSSYGSVGDNQTLLVDGGFGEIIRAAFFKRVQLYCSLPPIFTGDRIAAAFMFNRASFLRDDVFKEQATIMAERAGRLVHKFRSGGNSRRSINEFAVATRLPNFYGYAQGWIDNQAICYMPFAQQRLIHTIMSKKQSASRVNVRRHIRCVAPALSQIPLVKGQVKYPFRSNSLSANVIYRIKSSRNIPTPSYQQGEVLNRLREYALDRASSADHPAFVCRKKLNAKVEEYYSGDLTLTSFVDWWLAFDLWSRSLSD